MFLLCIRPGKSTHNPAHYFNHFCMTIASDRARLAMILSRHHKTAIFLGSYVVADDGSQMAIAQAHQSTPEERLPELLQHKPPK
jgi:hypothetical protein